MSTDRKPGRPPLPPEERRIKLTARISARAMRAVQDHAEANTLNLSRAVEDLIERGSKCKS